MDNTLDKITEIIIDKLDLVGIPIKITLSTQKNPFDWMGF